MCFQQRAGPKSTIRPLLLPSDGRQLPFVHGTELYIVPVNLFYTNFNTIEKKR